MTLSEAIRLGATLKPQGKGEGSIHHDSEATCAWGAAIQASGVGFHFERAVHFDQAPMRAAAGPSEFIKVYDIPDEWKVMARFRTECPRCSTKDQVYRLIAHLNDDHGLTRQEIADWIDSIQENVSIADPESVKVNA